MSNVINYSKPSATVFKRGIKDSVCMKHTTRWSVEAQWELGNGSPRAYTQALPEWRGQLPKTPRFSMRA